MRSVKQPAKQGELSKELVRQAAAGEKAQTALEHVGFEVKKMQLLVGGYLRVTVRMPEAKKPAPKAKARKTPSTKKEV